MSLSLLLPLQTGTRLAATIMGMQSPSTPQPARFGVILVAAGSSTRFGDANYKKPFVPLADRAVWLHSVERFLARDDVAQTVVVIAGEDQEEFQRKFGANLAFLDVDVTIGGATRTDSVRAGIAKLSEGVTHVAVHDAARPCISDDEIERVFAEAVSTGAAILATPITATLKRVAQGRIAETLPREDVWAAQTPQVFARDILEKAYATGDSAAMGDSASTDDSQLVQQLGEPVAIVEGSPQNLKITTQNDLKMAAMILGGRPRPKPDGAANPFAGDDMWR